MTLPRRTLMIAGALLALAILIFTVVALIQIIDFFDGADSFRRAAK